MLTTSVLFGEVDDSSIEVRSKYRPLCHGSSWRQYHKNILQEFCRRTLHSIKFHVRDMDWYRMIINKIMIQNDEKLALTLSVKTTFVY